MPPDATWFASVTKEFEYEYVVVVKQYGMADEMACRFSRYRNGWRWRMWNEFSGRERVSERTGLSVEFLMGYEAAVIDMIEAESLYTSRQRRNVAGGIP